MQKIALIYQSTYGHTKRVAEAMLQGLQSVDGIEAVLLTSDEAIEQLDDLKNYDGMVFGGPTYMGSISAEFKKFMDATAGVWYQQSWKNKLAGGFTNSGSLAGDKLNTLLQLATFAAQHSMLWVPLSVMNESSAADKTSGDVNCLNRVGSNVGVATQADNVDAAESPTGGDLKTAELYGKDFAEAVKRWNK